jgi:putative ABC transport system permease protein
MKLLHDVIGLWHRLAAFSGRRRRDQDLHDELAFHLAMRQAEHERAGTPPADAARAARRQFGNVAALKEQTGEMWKFPSFESLMQDVRYAFRSLLKAPGFSVVAILVLAIGIGANTAMFSLVDAMLLRGLPYRHADRLVVLIGNVQRATVERRGNSLPDHLDWRSKATLFDDMAAYMTMTLTLSGIDEPERIAVEAVSAPYFSVLGMSPIHGRTFRAEEDAVPNRDFVAVLSDRLWRRRFGADPSIVNRTIQLGPRTYTVLGIMPPGFTGVSDTAQLWIPFALGGYPPDDRGSRGFQTLARLKSGATIDQARAELNVISAQLSAAYRDTNDKRAVEMSPLAVETFGQLKPIVLTLMAAVSFVLLIACANVANLLIGRSDARQKEIAVRTALGAGQARLFRQLITESCVLTLVGAAVGLGLASVMVNGLTAASPVQFPTFVQPGLNMPVLAFTIGIALLCGVLLGLAPAMHSRVSRLTDALKDSARGSSGVRSQRLRGGLVIAEVALAIVLFVGAGLMIRSGQKLAAIDPGFDPSGVLTVNVSIPRQPAPPVAPGPPAAAVPGQPAPPPFVLSGLELLARVRAVPGVISVSLVSDVPLSGNSSAIFYSAEGDTTADAQTQPRAYWHRVSPEFFATLHLPLSAGRTFLGTDATPDSPAVIVSDRVTRRFWPSQDPIGKRIKRGAPDSPNPWLTIVGTVGETKYRALPSNPTADPDLYFPALDRSPQPVLIRTSVTPSSVTSAVRAAIRSGQPSVVVFGEMTMVALVESQTSASRFTTWILGLFATTALVLSVIGIYGVMSYLVAQRTREFGIRLALGATRADLVRVVLRHGTTLIAFGAVIGIAATAGLYRLFSSLLYEVTAVDVSSGLAILVLVGAAVLACIVPAIRATRVDPVIALRNS